MINSEPTRQAHTRRLFAGLLDKPGSFDKTRQWFVTTAPFRRLGRCLATTEVIAVAALLIFFVALQAIYPKMPGMIHEGLLMDQFLAAEIVENLQESSFGELLLNGQLPTRREMQTYHGTLMAYLYIPFLKFFGRSWMAAKYWPVLFAVLTLLFSYGFLRNLFDKRVALLSIFLLVIHPTYVIGTRIGGIWLNHMQFFSMGALYFLERWWSTRKNHFLTLAGFFVGLGLCTQLWFYWFLTGLLVSALLVRRETALRFGLSHPPQVVRLVLWGFFGFIGGAALLIYREIIHPLESVQSIMAHAFSPANPYAVSQYFFRILEVMRRIGDFVSGKHVYEFVFGFDGAQRIGVSSNPLYVCVVVLAALFLFSRPARAWRGKRVVVLPALFLTMILLTPISSHLPDIHLFFLYPLPPILIAVAAVALFDLTDRIRWRPLLFTLAFLPIAFKETSGLITNFSQLKTTGGAREFSDTIYDLGTWLRANHVPGAPVFFLWGGQEFQRHLYFILPDVSPKYEFLQGFTTEEMLNDFKRRLEAAPPDKPVLFVRHFFGILRQGFHPIVTWTHERGIPMQRLAVFKDEDNVSIFEVYKVGPPSATDRGNIRL